MKHYSKHNSKQQPRAAVRIINSILKNTFKIQKQIRFKLAKQPMILSFDQNLDKPNLILFFKTTSALLMTS